MAAMVTVEAAIEEFLTQQETLGLARSTLDCQRNYVRKFGVAVLRASKERGKRSPMLVREIDSKVIVHYFGMCSGREGNRNNWLIACRKFLTFCEAAGYLRAGDSGRLLMGRKMLHAERLPKYYVPATDFPVLLDACERHPVDRMVMALALFTLCRRSEIAAIQLRDIHLQERTISVHRLKRKRWTDVGIAPELRDELASWLSWMADHTGYRSPARMMEIQPDWHLVPLIRPIPVNRDESGRFTGNFDYEIDPMDAPRHMERVVKRALDVTGAVTPSGAKVRHLGEGMHTIRRSGARALLKHLSEELGSDRALIQVSTMLDHDDPKMTLRYIGLNQEREQLNDWLRSNSMYGSPARRASLRSIA